MKRNDNVTKSFWYTKFAVSKKAVVIVLPHSVLKHKHNKKVSFSFLSFLFDFDIKKKYIKEIKNLRKRDFLKEFLNTVWLSTIAFFKFFDSVIFSSG